MSKPLPYFCWYPADAETDAHFRAMDDADIGFYIRCLNHSWINGGIPADPKERARVLRTRKDTADKRWERVGKCFVPSRDDDNFLVNPRQEVEREHAMSKSIKASESAKARYERSADAPTRAYESVSVSNASLDFKEKNDAQRKSGSEVPTVRVLRDRFQEFIDPWPRVSNPDHAARCWISCVDTPGDEALAFAARDRYLASDEVSRGVTMDPARWLMNQKSAKWGGKWPPAVARAPNGRASTGDRVLARMAERISRGEKPL